MLLILILVTVWLAYQLWKKPPCITYSLTSIISRLAKVKSSYPAKIPLLLRTGCLVLLVIAAARPQLYNISRDIKSSGVDIMLLIDTSGSMQALDFKLDDQAVTRLTAVKKVVSDFIKKRKMDRIGLVAFGEEAFTQCPLTMDKGLLLQLVKKMSIGMAGDRTAIGSAIGVGGKRLKDLKAKSKIIILLTDGRNNAGYITPEQAAEAVQALEIKTYTIGVGGKGLAPFKVKTLLGTRIIHQRVDLDDETLKKVAKTCGGKYFSAADSKELAQVYDMIDKEQKTEIKVKQFFNFKELYHYFLIPALILLCLETLLRSTILRTIP
jgi:Ca-activated chloride channel family protein